MDLFDAFIGEIREDFRVEQRKDGERLAQRKRFLGDAADGFSIEPASKRQLIKCEEDLEKAHALMRETLRAYNTACVRTRIDILEMHRALGNPCEMGAIVIAGSQRQNCFEVLEFSHVRKIVQNLLHGIEASSNMVVLMRRALFFFGKDVIKNATRPFWGVLGSALLSQQTASIVIPAKTICIANNEAGDTIALYRVDPGKVAVFNVSQKKIVRELKSGIVQIRTNPNLPDIGTMAFDRGTEYYVVNRRRYTVRGDRVVESGISPQHGSGETIRLNRFINYEYNPPFHANAPDLVPVGTEAPPFYIRGTIGRDAFVTVRVAARTSTALSNEQEMSPVRFYGQDGESVLKYPPILKDQIQMPFHNRMTVFKMTNVANGEIPLIASVARIGRFFFFKLRGRLGFRVAFMPEEEFSVKTAMAFADVSGTYAIVPGNFVRPTEDEGNGHGNATIILKIMESVSFDKKQTTAFQLLKRVLDGVNQVAEHQHPIEGLEERRRRMNSRADALFAKVAQKPVPLIVKGQLVAVATGKRSCIQFDGTLIELADGIALERRRP